MSSKDICRPLIGSYLDEVTSVENRDIVVDLRLVCQGELGWGFSSYTITDGEEVITSELAERKDVLDIYIDTLDQMYSNLSYASEETKIETVSRVDQANFDFMVKYATEKNSSLTMNIMYYGNFYYNVPVGRELLKSYMEVADHHKKDALKREIGNNIGKNSFRLKLRARNRKDTEEK